MSILMADTDRRMKLEVRAIRPIVLCNQVPDEQLVTHTRQTALFAVDMLAT